MQPLNYKRIIAYALDILIITIISTLLTSFTISSEKYDNDLNKYIDVMRDYTENKIDKDEYVKTSNDLVYSMSKESLPVTIVTTSLTIIYFVVFAYFMNGQTLGKKIMNLQIVSSNKKKLNMNNYLIRGLIVNNIFMNIVGIITLICLNKSNYLKTNDIVTYIFGAIYLITIGMILFREDRRGLHDYLANTKVISLSKNVKEDEKKLENEDEKNSKLKDAEIIGEKKLKM